MRACCFGPPHSNYRSRTRDHHRSRALDRTGLDFNSGILARHSAWPALAKGSKSRALTLIDANTAAVLTTVMAMVNGTSRAQGKADWKKLGWKVGLAAALIAAGYGDQTATSLPGCKHGWPTRPSQRAAGQYEREAQPL